LSCFQSAWNWNEPEGTPGSTGEDVVSEVTPAGDVLVHSPLPRCRSIHSYDNQSLTLEVCTQQMY